MDGWLKQSTAITLRVGPFLDSTDGNTAESGLTITQAEVRLSKAGGDFAQKTEATSLAHDELGYYTCLLDATDTNTLGMLKLAVHEGGALAVWHDWMVVPANVWDSLFGADLLDVNNTQVLGTAIHAASENGTQCVEVVRWGGNDIAATAVNGVPKVALTHVNAAAQTATLDTIKAETVLIVADTNELQGDWVNAGRLDAILDIIAADTTTDIPALIADVPTVAEFNARTLVSADYVVVGDTIAAVTAATVTAIGGNVITAASLAADAGTEIAAAVWAKTGAITSIATELLLERLYEMVNNKMIVTEATGAVALRNLADNADVATGNVQDLGATTQRNALTWA